MPETFIVKVQRSLFTSDDTAQVLIYDETQSILIEVAATPSILALFGPNEVRAYYHAHLAPAFVHDEQNIVIGARAEDQSW